MIEYEIPLYKDKELLDEFLDAWSLPNVKAMTLKEYIDVNNKYTFTQWVESRTKSLGSIKGISSFKFGIYKRRKPNESPKSRVYSNKNFSWLKIYGECDLDEQKVFKQVKKRIISTIQYAQQLDFESIEKIDGLYNLFKWKVAFLYSNQSMVPIFKNELLYGFVKQFGIGNVQKNEYAKMHRYLYNKKPPNISVFNFMRKLFYEAGLLDENNKQSNSKSSRTKKGRKGTNDLNTEDYGRKGTKDTVVTQHHKKIQKQLKKYLEVKYPQAEITFEKNFIDLLLISNTEVHYYEVKTSQTPETCIKQGLGQLLSYSYYEEQFLNKHKGLKKKIVIFGKLKAKPYDSEFIKYVNETLEVNFEYLSLEEISI